MPGEPPAKRGDISRLRWQITAPPRSGTTWIAHWLTNNGYPTSHERCFLLLNQDDPRKLNPHYCHKPGDSAWLAAPWCWELREMGVVVIQLRRPLEDVAASMYRLQWNLSSEQDMFLGALTEFVPGVFEEEPYSYEQYLRFATEWTALIEPDVVWDLYDVGDRELAWMGGRFDGT